MSSYSITTGILNTPVKVVLYGPEGIGKSTFASHFPDPVFIDTADWAERLAIDAICAKAKVDGLEGFGYGNGYTYVKEEFGRLLDALEEVLNSGHHVLILAHAAITKFEQPDAAGSYDRWTMKTTKQTEPLLREWCDMLLFANYQTIVEKSGSSPNAKNKASGGKRVLYTTHHACWDAKNRFDLPDEIPFDYAAIAHCLPGSSALTATQTPVQHAPAPAPEADILPSPQPETKPVSQPQPQATPPMESSEKSVLLSLGVPENLAALMSANKVSSEELPGVVGKRGYFPEDMPIKDYPADFVEGCLIGAWPQVYQMVLDNRDIPF